MKVERLAIPDVLLITPQKFADQRGFFAETWSEPKLRAAGLEARFVQDNQSYSEQRGTIRGLHCQIGPHVQGKLVRVLHGAIWDVAVDARPGSSSFGRWVAAELSDENFQQLWVPPGFLHGFCTLHPRTEVAYKVTDIYARDTERGVIWNDKTLNLPWPVTAGEVLVSDKDALLPGWAEAATWFAE